MPLMGAPQRLQHALSNVPTSCAGKVRERERDQPAAIKQRSSPPPPSQLEGSILQLLQSDALGMPCSTGDVYRALKKSAGEKQEVDREEVEQVLQRLGQGDEAVIELQAGEKTRRTMVVVVHEEMLKARRRA